MGRILGQKPIKTAKVPDRQASRPESATATSCDRRIAVPHSEMAKRIERASAPSHAPALHQSFKLTELLNLLRNACQPANALASPANRESRLWRENNHVSTM